MGLRAYHDASSRDTAHKFVTQPARNFFAVIIDFSNPFWGIVLIYNYLFYLAVFLSIAPIASIIFVREAILRQRQFVIQALAKALTSQEVDKEKVDGLASFEIVKFKYFLDKSEGPEGRRNRSRDFKIWQWVATTIPLAIVLCLLYFFSIFCIARRMWPCSGLENGCGLKYEVGVQWIIVASFAASQLNMLDNFYRAVNNFDLSPSTFIEALIDIAIGVIVAIVVYYCAVIVMPTASAFNLGALQHSASGWSDYGTKVAYLFLVAFAFVTGYYPDVVKRNVVRAVKLNNYKIEDDSIFTSFEIAPVEIVDGIDSTIRKRLEDFHIYSVQNLATANPLMIYVETPFGIYQTLDWVAQAQLINVFGPRRIESLWKLGVRTIFDLERLALDNRYVNANLRRYLAEALVHDDTQKAQIAETADDFLKAAVGSIVDAPHVKRLRQIVMILSDRIGPRFNRLPGT